MAYPEHRPEHYSPSTALRQPKAKENDMLTEHTYDTGAVILNYAQGAPAGPPLVLLHGGSSRWQHFENIMTDLTAHWQVTAPDLRGHGKSSWNAGHYRLQDYADDLIALLEHCLAGPAHLFGHSLGGMIALLVAAQRPQLARSVIVGDSPLTSATWRAILNTDRDRLRAWRDLAGGAYPLSEIMEALKNTPIEIPGHVAPVPMREALGEDAPYFPWMAANLYQHDPRMLTALLDDVDSVAAGYEMETLLPQIRCPVLLLQADPLAGSMLPDREVRRAMQLLAQPQHVSLAGISHVLHNEQPAPVLAALSAFLAAH
jgi:pimeloyl-ACP methyl ester carboxylesterase